MLDKLKQLNNFPVYSINDPEFKRFGQVITGYDFSSLIEYIEKNTTVPEKGNIYVASVPEVEKGKLYDGLKMNLYGDMDIQIGYCNGNNSNLNGLEYHKGSEVNVAVTNLVLLLAHTDGIKNGEIDSSKVLAFYLPKGSVIELFQTAMHFAPCKLSDSGFKCVVVLPRHTNEELDLKNPPIYHEDKYLFKKNKWLLVHKDKQDLIDKGAYRGITGANLQVIFPT